MIRLLVIDDDELDRETVVRACKNSQQNFSIEIATNGKEGLHMLSSHDIDCLVLDYLLPDMNGLEFLDKMSNNLNIEFPAIVMLTGQGSEKIAVQAMKKGVLDYIPKNETSEAMIIQAIINSLDKAALQKELQEAYTKIEKLAMYDPLTELGNRNLFNSQVKHFIATSKRNKRQFYLLLMDLNNFKVINDTLGHLAGDTVLKTIGRRLKDISRASDMFFRFGGDEFSGLIETSNSINGIDNFIKRIQQAVEQPIKIDNEIRQVGISIGIALFPDDGKDVNTLLKIADEAMYSIKYINKSQEQPSNPRNIFSH